MSFVSWKSPRSSPTKKRNVSAIMPTAKAWPSTDLSTGLAPRNALSMVVANSTDMKKPSGPKIRSPPDTPMSTAFDSESFSSATAATPANIIGIRPENMARNGVPEMIQLSTLDDMLSDTG